MNPGRLVAFLVPSLLLCLACGYKAQVRGITSPDPRKTIGPGAKVCVDRYPDTLADEVTEEVAEKIQRLLTSKGYTISGEGDAEFFLLFEYDIKTLMTRARLEPISGSRTGIKTTKVQGPFDQTLSLRLVDAESYRQHGLDDYIWAGGAILDNIPTRSPRFIDLLLVAGLKHFPNDTGEVRELKMRLNDPQARELRQSWFPESAANSN